MDRMLQDNCALDLTVRLRLTVKSKAQLSWKHSIHECSNMLTCLAMMENNLIDFLQARSLNNNLSFSRCPLAPSMYKDKDGTLLIVHVDDVQGMGKEHCHCLRNLVTARKKKCVVLLEGPFLLAADYVRGFCLDTIKFLKRKFSHFIHKLSSCIDPKYIQKLEELFRLTHRKPKAAPCGNDIMKVDPNPVYLDVEDHKKYRTAIGILLYLSGDRPDIQFTVNVLSSG